jgi:hypothetical protein
VFLCRPTCPAAQHPNHPKPAPFVAPTTPVFSRKPFNVTNQTVNGPRPPTKGRLCSQEKIAIQTRTLSGSPLNEENRIGAVQKMHRPFTQDLSQFCSSELQQETEAGSSLSLDPPSSSKEQGCRHNPGHFDEVGFDTLSNYFDTTSNFDTSSKLCQKQGFDTTKGLDKVSQWPTHKKVSLRPDHPAPHRLLTQSP